MTSPMLVGHQQKRLTPTKIPELHNYQDKHPDRTLEQLLGDHEFLAGTLASAFLYCYARLTVALFAGALGVQPSDLDLGTEDHVFVAFAWIVLLAVAYVLFPAQQRSLGVRRGSGFFDHAGQWLFGTAALGLLFVFPALVMPGINPLVAYMLIIAAPLVVGGLVYGVAKVLGAEFPWTWVLLAAFGLFTLLAGGLAATQAGRGLRDNPSDTNVVPLPLKLVLPPSVGAVALEDSNTCALRVAPRVFIDNEGVLVFSEPPRFRVDDCELD